MKRIDGARLLDVEERIVPPRNDRRHVVAPALVVRIVDDADRAMADRLVETGTPPSSLPSKISSASPTPASNIAASKLPRARRRNAACRSIGAPHSSAAITVPRCVPKPTSTHAVMLVRLPHELADVHHPGARHVGEARVADVRVVLPDDRLRARAVMRISRSSVSTMWRSRTFHDAGPPRTIVR